jgi:molecular chaperone Hsp33
MFNKDTSQRFIFEKENVRGEIVHVDNTFKTIIAQRDYPKDLQKLLGEALLACVLITGGLKFKGEVSLQFHGDERLPLLLVQCNDELCVRAVAKFKKTESLVETIDYNQAFNEGKLVLNLNQYNSTKTYQSIVPVKSGSLAESIMYYFAQSEQISTQIHLAVDEDKAAGILLQLMPDQSSKNRENFWEYAVKIAETITDKELLNLDNQEILYRLYHEEDLNLFEPRQVMFRCGCDIKKIQQILLMFGEREARQILAENGEVSVNCDFCNKNYTFDEIDITLLFK